jgi:hypothetical protein
MVSPLHRFQYKTKERMKATTDFEKVFFKLMNNAYYGKTCENIRNRKDIELTTESERSKKLHVNPKYAHSNIFNDSVEVVIMQKGTIFFDKPIYIGASFRIIEAINV